MVRHFVIVVVVVEVGHIVESQTMSVLSNEDPEVKTFFPALLHENPWASPSIAPWMALSSLHGFAPSCVA